MSFTSIHNILDKALKTVPTLPSHQTENNVFKPANQAAWCRSTLLPAATTVESIGTNGREKKNGLYQVDLFYINNSGYADAYAMADLLIGTFGKGLYLTDLVTTVMITRSYINSARPFPNYMQLPVVIEWECFV